MKLTKFKPSKKHLQIFNSIAEKGFYKPRFSDQEPATKKLEKLGIVEWRNDFRGVILSEYGKSIVEQLNKPINNDYNNPQ